MFVAAGCSPIADRRGMTIMYPSPQFREKVLIFVCRSGYRLIGKKTLYCDGEEWSGSPPVCVEQPSTTATVLHQTSYVPTSPSGVPRTPVRSSSTEMIGESPATSTTSRIHLPASFLTHAPPRFTSDRVSTTVSRDPGTDVSQRQRGTGDVTMTSSDAASAMSLTRRVSTSRLVPLSTLSDIGGVTGFSKNFTSLTSFFVGLRSTLAGQRRTVTTTPVATHASSNQFITTPSDVTSDTLEVINDSVSQVMQSAVDPSGSRHTSKLVWYGTLAGASAVLLVVVIGVAVSCGLAVRRRAPAVRRYRLMDRGDQDDEMMQTVTAASGRSMFYATQYTLAAKPTASSCSINDDEQQTSLQQTLSNDNCSFV